MRIGWLVAVAWYLLGLTGSALAQDPSWEQDRPTDASHSDSADRADREMQPMGASDVVQADELPPRRARMREIRRRYRDATPEHRKEMRAERLRRMHSFEFRRHADSAMAQMSREQRAALRAEVRALPDEERRELRRKLRHFHSLSEIEQAELKQRFGALRALDSVEQEQIDYNSERWKQMPPHRRAELRDTWKRFRALPLEVQQEVLGKALLDASPTK
jgi:hypothetical protein